MKKRILAILLVVAMLCTLMVGCSSGSNDNDTSTPDTTSTGTSTPADDGGDDASTGGEREKVDGIMYKTGLPIVDEGAYTFSMFCDDSAKNDNEFAMIPILQEQTNVVVDLQYFPNENATERLNLDLNSGEYADCIGGWLLNESMVMQYGADGTFIPLEDIYAEYCPRIMEILDLPGVREKMTFPDGHIYTIPYVTGDTTVNYSPWINSEWLERLDLEMPTTTEEFEKVLEAFKNEDANGNGDKTDEIPFSADPNNKHIEAMAGYFGMPMDKEGFSADDDCNAIWAGTSTEYREFLKWFNGLYNKGLLDPELFTQDSAMWEGKGNKDMYGVSIAYGSGEFSGWAEKTKGPHDPLPVLNADKGGKWLRATSGFSVYRTQAVITDNAEHPEIIARWFDNAFSLENGIGCAMGPVGIKYIDNGDGTYTQVPDSEIPEDKQEYYGWNNLWVQSMPKYLPKDFDKTNVIKVEDSYNEKYELEQYYEQWLTKGYVPQFFVPEDMIDMYSEYATSIQDYFNEMQAKFVTGIEDINDDAAWQAYKDQLDKLHLDEYLEARGVTKRAD